MYKKFVSVVLVFIAMLTLIPAASTQASTQKDLVRCFVPTTAASYYFYTTGSPDNQLNRNSTGFGETDRPNTWINCSTSQWRIKIDLSAFNGYFLFDPAVYVPKLYKYNLVDGTFVASKNMILTNGNKTAYVDITPDYSAFYIDMPIKTLQPPQSPYTRNVTFQYYRGFSFAALESTFTQSVTIN